MTDQTHCTVFMIILSTVAFTEPGSTQMRLSSLYSLSPVQDMQRLYLMSNRGYSLGQLMHSPLAAL